MRRTSRGRRDLPLSFKEVEGTWVGCATDELVGAVVLLVPDAAGCWEALTVLVEGSAGGVRGWVDGPAVCDWFGEAIVLRFMVVERGLGRGSGREVGWLVSCPWDVADFSDRGQAVV